jgi:hypothetical protein
MIPRDGDMNNIGSWNEDGDISWAVDLNDDGYAIIPEGDSITQTMELTNTIEYWQFSSYAQSGYQDSDELQVEIWNGAESFSYEGTLPISGFIDIPLTTTAVVTLTGVSSPTHLSYFCLHYAEECQFPDPELINLNYQWEPPERFGDLIGTYESYGGAQLDAGERFYQSIANDYPTQGDYSFHISGTATAPITLGVKLESCGLSGAGLGDDGYYQIPISPTGGVFDYYENVRCDGYNRLQVKNLGTSAVFVDRVCLEDALTCQPLGECNLDNEDFTERDDLFYDMLVMGITGTWGLESWHYDYDNNTSWAPYPGDQVYISPTGYISQETCLDPGGYTLEVWAKITGTGLLWLPLRAAIDGQGQTMDILGGDADYYTLYTFDFYVSSATDYHELLISHGGSRNTLIIERVCLRRDEEVTEELCSCGYINNCTFVNTAPYQASPWRVYQGDDAEFNPSGEVHIPYLNGIKQDIFVTDSDVITYSFGMSARADRRARIKVTLGTEGDDVEEYFDIAAFGWHTYTFTSTNISEVTDVSIDSVALYGGHMGSEVVLNWTCLVSGTEFPTTTMPTTGTDDCSLCDVPDPETGYRGKPDFEFTGWSELFQDTAEYLGEWFDWLKCWVICYLKMILAALRDFVNDFAVDIIGVSIPSFADIQCFILSIPRRVVNGIAGFVDDLSNANPLAWMKRKFDELMLFFDNRLYGLTEGSAQFDNWVRGHSSAVDQVTGFIMHIGDLYVAFVNILLLLIIVPLEIIGIMFGAVVVLFWAIANYSPDTVLLPAEDNLFWCFLDLLEWTITSTPLVAIPGLYIGFLLWDTLKWALHKFGDRSEA